MYKKHWEFKRELNFNHGSFGAVPKNILAKKHALEEEIFSDSNIFMWSGRTALLDENRKAIASLIDCALDDVVFVDNATDGFNSVLKSFPFEAGDHIIITNHVYGNFPPVLKQECKSRGVQIDVVHVPYPVFEEDDILQPILKSVTNKTKLAIIDHITSPTALIFPVKKIVQALQERNVSVFIDGAHAPGQIDISMRDIGADFYIGNHHKWLCAPMASAFLYVDKASQHFVIPSTGSGQATDEHSFTERFYWTGTQNPAAFLMVADTIAFMSALHEQGIGGVQARNHQLAVDIRSIFAERFHCDDLAPDEFIGSMFTLPIGALTFPEKIESLLPVMRLYSVLEEKFGFGAYAVPHADGYLLRVSCHLYNELGDFDRLADAIAWAQKEFGAA